MDSGPPHHHTMPSDVNLSDLTTGSRLQVFRQQAGLSVAEVAEQTHISTSNLLAIENDQYDKLPADTFIRGLVAMYGDFLNIDGKSTAKAFLRERDDSQPRKRNSRGCFPAGRSLAPKKLAEPAHISSATVAGILLILIVTSFSLFCLYSNWNPFAYFINSRQQNLHPLASITQHQQAVSLPVASDEPLRQTVH